MEYKNGIAKASCRSITGIDIGKIINEANNKGLLIKGGGHAMAGGYSCEISKLEDFKKFCLQYVKNHHGDAVYKKIIEVDSNVSLSSINNDFYNQIEKLGPFGPQNSEPIFYANNIKVLDIKQMAQIHLAIIFKCLLGGKTIRSVIFNFENHKALDQFLLLKGQEVDIAFKIKQNNFYNPPQIEAEILEIIYTIKQ